MNTDDNKAILEELETAWEQPMIESDSSLIRSFSNRASTDVGQDRRRFAAAMYLSAKRKYQQPVSATGEVRTARTFEEWWSEFGGRVNFTDTWDAALASVISTGKRFEVGDRVIGGDSDSCTIVALVDDGNGGYWRDPADVRPIPQTVELTDDEKFLAIVTKNPDWTARDALVACQGKTLDELCAQYGVETTRRV